MADARLEILMSLRDDASRALEGVRGRLGPLGSGFSRFGSIASTAMRTLRQAILPVTAALGGAIFVAFNFASAASDLAEAQNKANVVFKGAVGVVNEFAKTSANSFGISNRKALDYAGTLGGILQVSGLTQEASAGMSVELIKLAADLASFNNIPIDEALEKIRSGLVGEAEPLRTVQVLLSEARVAEEAYATGIAATGAVLTEAQKVQARYQVIMKDTALQQGDFTNTMGGLANMQRRVGALWEELRANLGEALLPVIERVFGVLVAVLGNPIVPVAIGAITGAISDLASVFSGALLGDTQKWADAYSRLPDPLQRVADVVTDVALFLRQDLGPAVKDTALAAKDLAEEWGPKLWDPFKTGVETVRDVGQPAIEEFVNFIIDNKPALIVAIAAIGVAIFLALGPVSQAAIAITGLIMLIGFVRDNFDELKPILSGVAAGMAVVAGVITVALLPALVAWAVAAAAAAAATLLPLLPLIAVGIAVGALVYLIVAHWDTIVRVTKAVWNTVKDFLLGNWQEILKIASLILLGPAGLVVLFTTNAFGIRDKVVAAIGAIPGLLRGLAGDFFGAAFDLGAKLIDGLKDALTGVGGFASDVGSAVLRAVKSVVNQVIREINSALEFKIPVPFAPDISINPPDIPELARGGPVSAGRPYLVGERGAELFIPQVAGQIVPATQGAASAEPNGLAQVWDWARSQLRGLLQSIVERSMSVGRAAQRVFEDIRFAGLQRGGLVPAGVTMPAILHGPEAVLPVPDLASLAARVGAMMVERVSFPALQRRAGLTPALASGAGVAPIAVTINIGTLGPGVRRADVRELYDWFLDEARDRGHRRIG